MHTDWSLVTGNPTLGDPGAPKAWGVEHLSAEDRNVSCDEVRSAAAQQHAVRLLTNRTGADHGPVLPLRSGLRVYAEGFEHGVLESYATTVIAPADAHVAVLRLKAPWEPAGDGPLASSFHGGSLAIPAQSRPGSARSAGLA